MVAQVNRTGRSSAQPTATKSKRTAAGDRKHDKTTDHDLTDSFFEELADILNAEKQLVKALPAFEKAVQSAHLKEAVSQHLRETQQHVERAEQVFKTCRKPARTKVCKAMKGLIAEAKDILKKGTPSPARDALIIASAQKIEHYEIAAYGTLREWAYLLGNREATQLITETLREEKEAHQLLTGISTDAINALASGEDRNKTSNQERSGMQTERSYSRSRRGWSETYDYEPDERSGRREREYAGEAW